MTLDFPLLLVITVVVCGALALVDLVLFAPHRRAAISSYEGQMNEPDPVALEKLSKGPLLVEYSRLFFPVLLIVLVLCSFLVRPFQIPSGSMKPTLEVGDFILVNKFACSIRLSALDTEIVPIDDPQRGNVMAFRHPSEPNINCIKRAVGLPDDAVRHTREKRLYVNDKLVAEELVGEEPSTLGSVTLYQEKLGRAKHLIYEEMSHYYIEPDHQWAIPAGRCFMIGSNRNNSNNSRYRNDPKIPKDLLGVVPDRNIVGKTFTVWMSRPDLKTSSLSNFSRADVIH